MVFSIASLALVGLVSGAAVPAGFDSGVVAPGCSQSDCNPRVCTEALCVTDFGVTNNVTRFSSQPIIPDATLPQSQAQSHADEIVSLFQTVSRSTTWKLVDTVHLAGDLNEPEGMALVGEDRLFVSGNTYYIPTVSYGNGTVINGTDRTPGLGTGHIAVYDVKTGELIADSTISRYGSIEYHNGGIDFSGGYIWSTIAQYRPNGTATVMRVDPYTLEATPLLHFNDHLGGSMMDPTFRRLTTVNWGARTAYAFDVQPVLNSNVGFPAAVEQWNFTTVGLDANSPAVTTLTNPTSFVDYQDCKFLGHPKAYGGRPIGVCSGVANVRTNQEIGGVALVDLNTFTPVYEIPISMLSELGKSVAENPFDISVVNGHLRLYFLPDQNNSTLYVYEA